MGRTGSVVAIGTSLGLAILVSLRVAAQEPAVGSLALIDAAGDLVDVDTGEPIEGPGYMDLTGLEVSADGGQLAIRFDVADTVPAAPDPLHTSVDYVLNIDTDGDGFQDYHVAVGSEGGWQATLFDYDTVFETELGEAVVADRSLGAIVLLSELGFPSEMRFQGLMSGLDVPDPVDDPLTFTEWEDRAPDGFDEWRAFGESDAPSGEEVAVPSGTPGASPGTRAAAQRAALVTARHTGQGRARMPGHTGRISEATMRPARFTPILAVLLSMVTIGPAAAQGTDVDPGADVPPPISEPEDLESAVVFIEASGQFADPSGTSDSASSGSGFIISPDGNIVTANHVVAGANVVWVEITGRDMPVNAIVLGRSECDDLALLDVPLDGLPYLAWSDTPPVAGLPVVAVGFPDGDRRFFRARGQINREPGPGVTNWASIEEEIEHDATTAPGASGGPLVDGSTRVAGVHYAGLNNRSYAIAAHEAMSVLERFADDASPGSILTIGLNGEAFAATDTMPAGVFVHSVERGSPAAQAGIKAGDLITTLNGVPLAEDGTMSAYCAVLRSTRPSSVLDVEIFRPDGAFLTGQVNGTPLVDSGTIPFDDTEPVGSGAPVGPGDARVLASIPEDIRPTCEESPPEDWPREAIASVKCFPGSGVDVIWYDLFGTADAMDEYYFAVVTENGQTRSSGGPCNKKPGEVTFDVGEQSAGRLVCYRRDDSVWFVWKTNPLLTVSTAARSGDNQRPIYDFWTTAGPLF